MNELFKVSSSGHINLCHPVESLTLNIRSLLNGTHMVLLTKAQVLPHLSQQFQKISSLRLRYQCRLL